MEYFPYAGIGGRETPADVLDTMRRLAKGLAARGYTLRSGAARGADSAFETGAKEARGACEIFLPWNGFQPNYVPGKESPSKGKRWASQPGVIVPSDQDFERATAEALKVWPREIPWDRMKKGTQKLQARNSFQLLGHNLNAPALFVLYWNNEQGGGTGQALRLAEYYGIPTHKVEPGDRPDEVLALFEASARESVIIDAREDVRSGAEPERHWSEWDDPGGRDVHALASFDHYRPEVFDGLYDD